MKSRNTPTLSLLIGILVAFLALSAGSAPIAGMAGSPVGGFTDTWSDGRWVAATYVGCVYCSTTISRPCGEYVVPSGECWGGNVSVAYCVDLGRTTHAGGLSVCTGTHPWCTDLYDALCY